MCFYNTREPNSFQEITGSIWELSASSGTSCSTSPCLCSFPFAPSGLTWVCPRAAGSSSPSTWFSPTHTRQAGQAVCNLCLGSTVVSPLWRDWKAVDATTQATPSASLGSELHLLWGQAGPEQARSEPRGFPAAPPGRMLSAAPCLLERAALSWGLGKMFLWLLY